MTQEKTTEPSPTGAPTPDGPVDRAASSLRGRLPQSLLLSQMLGQAPAPGQPYAYVPPTAPLRSEARGLIHTRALNDIVRLRFGFPTEKYRDFKTYVNHPARTMGVQMRRRLPRHRRRPEPRE
jgi:hypothetical protein